MKSHGLSGSQKGRLLLFSCVSLFLLLGGILLEAVCFRLPLFSGTVDYREPQWFFGQEGRVLRPAQLSDKNWVEPGKTYLLTTRLTYSGRGDDYPCAFITTGNYETRVYLDGKLLLHHTREDRGFPHSQSLGGAAFTVPLGEDCQGKQLTLSLATPMDYASQRRLPDIWMGDYASILHNLFLTYLPSVLISTAILFVVMALVMLGNLADGTRWTYLYFSAFSYLIVLYRGVQDLFFHYIWANPYMAFLCEFFSIAACPIPLLLAYRNELKPFFRRTFNVTIGVLSVSFWLQVVLHFTGIVDAVQFLQFNHLMLGVSAAVLLCALFAAARKNMSLQPFYKLVPILMGTVLDMLSYYYHNRTIGPGSFFSVGNYIGLGLLTSLIFMVWEARKERERAFRQVQRSEKLEEMAYRDDLTGISNRAAFTREMAEIQAGTHRGESVLVVAADLNGLKRVNDRQGHGAGDRLLQQAAELMTLCFQPRGKVFRTGGDEFFVILYRVTEPEWEQMQEDFRRQLDRRNSTQETQLSVAMGHAFMEGEDLKGCIDLADRRMYENKSTFPNHRTEEEE